MDAAELSACQVEDTMHAHIFVVPMQAVKLPAHAAGAFSKP